MRLREFGLVATALAALAFGVVVARSSEDPKSAADHGAPEKLIHLVPEEKTSEGSVTVGGNRIDYQAVLGTLVVHPKGWEEAGQEEAPPATADSDRDKEHANAEAAMSFVAYLKHGAQPESRPLTFLYNGGPGGASHWLHMGAFGPKRLVTPGDTHSPPAPYPLVNNDESLLDASDLVFIDAPGTGFGRLVGKDKEKAFWGVDEDGHAFADFITQFISKYGRWNSPKYIFGESYGTTRSAILANLLQSDAHIDLNGVVMLSQILAFDDTPTVPQSNPTIDLPYVLSLPTYAAAAWYHHKLPDNPKELKPLIDEVEHFAVTDYAEALAAGNQLPDAGRREIAEKLHRYTGLPAAYILKADLRVNGGEFEKTLQDDDGLTTGRYDARFSGPTLDPLSEEADYDPVDASLEPVYTATFNDYVRKDLKYSGDRPYVGFIPIWEKFHFAHKQPGPPHPFNTVQSLNVMPDLAMAMKTNPNLKVLVNAGYFDLATPFFEAVWEMRHLPIPASLQSNIEFQFYESGHMVYANPAALKQLHDTVANFIRRTSARPPQ